MYIEIKKVFIESASFTSTMAVAQKCPTGQSAISRQLIEIFFIKISCFIAEVVSNNP